MKKIIILGNVKLTREIHNMDMRYIKIACLL